MDTDLHLWFFIFYNKEYIFDVLGGQGWSRTTVLGFSVRHTDRVCHLPIYKTQKEKIVGFEPTTFCLTDKCSTNELNFFLKEKIAVCVFNMVAVGWTRTNDLLVMSQTSYQLLHPAWLRRQDSNLRFLTYEDSEIDLFSTPQWCQ